MTDEFLQPSSLDAPEPKGKPDPGKKGPPWIGILVVAVLVALAGIRFLSRKAGDVTVAPVPPPVTPVPAATPDPALRAAAESALENVLELSGALRATEPERWASDPWTRIQQGIEKGDQSMAEKKFREAADQYESLLRPLEELSSRLPGLPGELMPQARKAYERGHKEDAVALLQIVLFLQPEHAEAKALLPRAETADQSFEILEKSKVLVEEDSWDLAWAELNRLEKLDAEFPGREPLQNQVLNELSKVEFEKWIAQAVLALEQGDVVSAESLVDKASGFRPDDPSVIALQKQIRDRRTQQKVLEVKAEAEQFESRENWAEAHTRWLEMKTLDPEAPWIQAGLEKSLKWKILEEKIRKGLENPASAQTGEWVKEMQIREGWPSGLKRDAERLMDKRLLAITPVSVKLLSDFETRVEISKVGRWEPFLQKEISLKPGSYVAKGIRLGYRDVRVPFEVKPGQQDLQIEVICREGI